jgi:hypothetical protein
VGVGRATPTKKPGADELTIRGRSYRIQQAMARHWQHLIL